MKKRKKLQAFLLAFMMAISVVVPSVPVLAAADYGNTEEMEQLYEAKAKEVIDGFGFDENRSDHDKVYAITRWRKSNVHYEMYEYRRSNGISTNGYTKHTDWPHTYTVISNTATCTKAGTITKMCLDCGALLQKGEEITHHWDAGTVTKAPTCTEAGEKVYHCTDDGCSETKTEAVKATGHSWDSGIVTTAPTCENHGESRTVTRLADMGFSVDEISEIVKMSTTIVRIWPEGNMKPMK